MRILLSALACAVLLSCGGSPTGPGENLPSGPLQMAIVTGDSQEVAVTDTLPFDAVTRVMKGGEPLSGQLVDWVVTADNCGRPFVSTTETDSTGRTGNRAVAGTRAWTVPDAEDFCRMEVRYALTQGDSVIARVDTAFHYLVLPGPAVDTVGSGTAQYGAVAPHTFPAEWLADQYGNPVPYRLSADSVFAAQSTDPDSASSRTLDIRSTASNGDSAVVCAYGRDGGLVFPALGIVHDGGTDIRLEVQGDPDPNNDYGTIQPSDCTS